MVGTPVGEVAPVDGPTVALPGAVGSGWAPLAVPELPEGTVEPGAAEGDGAGEPGVTEGPGMAEPGVAGTDGTVEPGLIGPAGGTLFTSPGVPAVLSFSFGNTFSKKWVFSNVVLITFLFTKKRPRTTMIKAIQKRQPRDDRFGLFLFVAFFRWATVE